MVLRSCPSITPEKKGHIINVFSLHGNVVVGTCKKRLGKGLLMSTHNISLHGAIRINISKVTLTEAMDKGRFLKFCHHHKFVIREILMHQGHIHEQKAFKW